jgi:hypothetical protein
MEEKGMEEWEGPWSRAERRNGASEWCAEAECEWVSERVGVRGLGPPCLLFAYPRSKTTPPTRLQLPPLTHSLSPAHSATAMELQILLHSRHRSWRHGIVRRIYLSTDERDDLERKSHRSSCCRAAAYAPLKILLVPTLSPPQASSS